MASVYQNKWGSELGLVLGLISVKSQPGICVPARQAIRLALHPFRGNTIYLTSDRDESEKIQSTVNTIYYRAEQDTLEDYSATGI